MSDGRPENSRAPGIRADILSVVDAAPSRLTPLDLQRQLNLIHGHNRRRVRAAVADLLADGELCYTNESGRTLIERSFNRPVRVSRRIVLVPAGQSFVTAGQSVAVILNRGAAFGDGRHVSTRLGLLGIEAALDHCLQARKLSGEAVLDIGTGSGVLLLAAVLLGFGRGTGVDIDPCAVWEAALNAAANGLESRIRITDQALDVLVGSFALITANLRWPTLKAMRGRLKLLTAPGGALVLSGINAGEIDEAVNWYIEDGFDCRHRQTARGWACAVFQRTPEKKAGADRRLPFPGRV